MELAKFNDNCKRCPVDTYTPLFDQTVHFRGLPVLMGGGEGPHVEPEVKVIEGSSKEDTKIS